MSNLHANTPESVLRVAIPDGHERICRPVVELVKSGVDTRIMSCGASFDSLESVQRILRQFWSRADGRAELQQLRDTATELTGRLLDEELTAFLQTCDASSITIEVSPMWHAIPWELLVIDGQFLCERMAIGRKITGIGQRPTNHISEHRKTLQLLAVPDSELVASQREFNAVRRLFREIYDAGDGRFDRPQCLYSPATAEEIAARMNGSGVFHFTGHARLDEGVRGWQLAQRCAGDHESNGNVLTPEMMAALPADNWPELIVAHACASAAINEGQEASLSMVEACLQKGVGNYVGTLAPMLDEHGYHFVEPFYSALAEGHSVGSAMQQAREHMRKQLPDGSLSWLNYVLYGDPDFVLVHRDHTHTAQTCEAEDFSSRKPDVLKPKILSHKQCSVDKETLPTCSTCGRQIETRHGIGRREIVNGAEIITCQSCLISVPPETPPVLVTTSVEASQGEVFDQDGHEILQELRNREKRFDSGWEEAVGRFWEFRDVDSGICETAILQLISEEPSVADPSSLQRVNGAASGISERPQLWRRQYRLAVQTRKARLPDIRVTCDEMCGKDDRQAPCDTPVNLGQLTAMLESRSPAKDQNETGRRVHVVVSLTGWETECVSYICGTGEDRFIQPGRSVLLIDAVSGESFHRESDLGILPFLSLTDLEDDESQLQRVLKELKDRLPLAVSLGSQELADELNVRITSVETAFRVASEWSGFDVDDFGDIGLVLSQRGLSENATRSHRQTGIRK